MFAMADISTIVRLPGDGAQDDSENVEQGRCAQPSSLTCQDENLESKQITYQSE